MKDKRVLFCVPTDQVEAACVGGILDMLRYDACRVESNAPRGFYLFSKDKAYGPVAIARWRSFGMSCYAYAGYDVPKNVPITTDKYSG